MSESSTFTLADVVNEPSLMLVPVVPGDNFLPVRGAHTTEIQDPGRWFEPGWVVLTTGLRFVGADPDPAMAARLVADLKAAGITALLFGIGIYFDKVPAPLVAACRLAGFPLYTVAEEVPFYVVENFINQTKSSPDAYLVKRAMWLSNELLDSLSADDPVRALIERLGSACRGTAVLYEDSGRIIESTGEGPTRLIFNELAAHEGTGSLDIGRWHVLARPLVLRGTGYTVAIATRNKAVLSELGEALLDTTQRLLGAINGINQIAMSRERHENVQLLTTLQDGISVAREFRHWERMRLFRFVPYEPLRAVMASTTAGAPLHQPLVNELLERAMVAGLGLLLAESGRTPDAEAGLQAVVSNSSVLHAWLELAGKFMDIGFSEPFTDLASAPDAFREAETARTIARRRSRAARGAGSVRGTVVMLDEVDPATWLLALRASPMTEDKVSAFTRSLDAESDLRTTVICYLALDHDVAKVAKHLFVHPNTVRYRLHKAEGLLHGTLTTTSLIANLYLAFQDEILAVQENWRDRDAGA
ncbi:PucR family transcriptional regulator [Arthrobacter sp. SDTb3-6]|uniref:PucR family transcriptional regulator n=1 Tax=Arthrobacter sp. SDTb3-6 TaxID=2713571 RepID=UPI00159DBC9A|nr:PucR family transcriptional regulator [Arthrobacter sp. SDTb3-6]NVN00388.1 PucR family transcriptional regulator [Arthrobacter sp. SDTb3-6]